MQPKQNESVQFLAAGTKIIFDKATESEFGTITVVEGVLNITYFDNTTALVRMGKFPVLNATVLTDSWIIIENTKLDVIISEITTKSDSHHVKWYEKSCWR